MKRYAIYESIKNGDSFDRFINAVTENDALNIAQGEWDHMSDYDKNRRTVFDLAFVDPEDPEDEDFADVPESDYTPIKSWVNAEEK